MMLSICIPVYNFEITTLIETLEQQLASIQEEVNLIVIDDASDSNFLTVNQQAAERHTYLKLKENIGRSKIRNRFIELTSAPYLLFLDCDVIVQTDFIKKYIDYINLKAPEVLCGGRNYPTNRPEKEKLLSYNYGVNRESRPALERNKAPNDAFMTNNFIIQREILENYPFDERLTQYGHEDTLLGFELKKAGIYIHHIDNSVINGDIETNSEYLKKTEVAIYNLVSILKNQQNKADFIKSVRLLDVYFNQLNKFSRYILKAGFSIFKKPIATSLRNGNSPLFLFDVFKLGILGEIFQVVD